MTYYRYGLRRRVRLTVGMAGMKMRGDDDGHGGRRETKLWTHLRPLDRT